MIGHREVLDAITAVVEELGEDFHYINEFGETPGSPDEHGYTSHAIGCHYLHGNEPGCIVGRVLLKLGVSKDVLRENEGLPINMVAFDSVEYMPTNHALQALRRAQIYQDNGHSYGDALKAFMDDMPRIG